MERAYKSKQELREDLESRTSPDGTLEDVTPLMHSPFLAGLLGVRSGISLLQGYMVGKQDFPNERHREITDRILAGMSERMTAFELELLNAIVELSWEVNICECDHCKRLEAEQAAQALRDNAKNN